MAENPPKIHRFGCFELDLEQRLLCRAGEAVPLTPESFDTLVVLVERKGKVVDKAELLRLVWPDTFVEENNLTQNISVLRKIFGDGDYIETIPRRGYRFLKAVEDVSGPEGERSGPQTTAVAPRRRFGSLWIWMAMGAAAMGLAVYAVDRIRS